MPNLSMTLECNRECSYCFAKSISGLFSNQTLIDQDRFSDILDRLEKSDIKKLHLLGGEPTLYPHFEWAVEKGLRRGFCVFIFTNGLITTNLVKFLEGLQNENIRLVINLRSNNEESRIEANLQQVVLSRLSSIVTLGCNIYSRNPRLETLIEKIMKYKLVRQVRLGLAHRSLNGDNAFLHPKYYRQIGKEIYRFAKSANKCNINVMLDCGFVPCMFPESFFLIQNINADNVGQCCGPIPDIMPDGSIIHCYPLAMASNITKVENWDLNEIKRILEKQVSKYRSIGIYDECKSCEYLKSGACVGGCLAMSMNRLSSTVNIGKPLAHQINAIKNNGDFI